jgi:hypothetical protein
MTPIPYPYETCRLTLTSDRCDLEVALGPAGIMCISRRSRGS